jgi:hypothetical protein
MHGAPARDADISIRQKTLQFNRTTEGLHRWNPGRYATVESDILFGIQR